MKERKGQGFNFSVFKGVRLASEGALAGRPVWRLSPKCKMRLRALSFNSRLCPKDRGRARVLAQISGCRRVDPVHRALIRSMTVSVHRTEFPATFQHRRSSLCNDADLSPSYTVSWKDLESLRIILARYPRKGLFKWAPIPLGAQGWVPGVTVSTWLTHLGT